MSSVGRVCTIEDLSNRFIYTASMIIVMSNLNNTEVDEKARCKMAKMMYKKHGVEFLKFIVTPNSTHIYIRGELVAIDGMVLE